jgi:hypothetical protein
MLHLGENRSGDEPTPNTSNAQEFSLKRLNEQQKIIESLDAELSK